MLKSIRRLARRDWVGLGVVESVVFSMRWEAVETAPDFALAWNTGLEAAVLMKRDGRMGWLPTGGSGTRRIANGEVQTPNGRDRKVDEGNGRRMKVDEGKKF